MMMSRSSPDLPEPDIMIYWVPGNFPGFFHGFQDELASTHNALAAIVLKAHPSTRGVVKLTGNHPQDPLQIEKRHFEAPGGQADIASIREAIKVARSIVGHPNITQHVEAQLFPGPDEEIDDHILEHVFGMWSGLLVLKCSQHYLSAGHHACCTNPMGTDDGVFFGCSKFNILSRLAQIRTLFWTGISRSEELTTSA
jgi:choline dehydrogenase